MAPIYYDQISSYYPESIESTSQKPFLWLVDTEVYHSVCIGKYKVKDTLTLSKPVKIFWLMLEEVIGY